MDQTRSPHDHNDQGSEPSLNQTAFQATVHCLTGCAIGEVLGMVIGTALGLGNLATIALAVGTALGLAFASDTISITIMEIVDNAIMLVIPGAMDAGLDTWLFWGSLVFSLVVAGVAAFPVNRWLIARGRGHAVLHRHHH